MKILVIGSGGREHALAWKLAQSKNCDQVFVAPGNGGTSKENKVKNIDITNISELINFAKNNDISFSVVGPEAQLADGIVDAFRSNNLKIWGPTKFCAQLESSKAFAKDFMIKYNIPTAAYKVFDNQNEAIDYVNTQNTPIVIKADGLAAGKGVLVANTIDEAVLFIKDIFNNNIFGKSDNKVVIEEFLDGVEASFIVMIDGNNILAMASSQDHKRLLDGDLGPNTGGMGAYSPAPIVNSTLHDRVINEIIQPVIDGMRNEGHEYSGFLYAGLMIDKNGNPKTLEFNCRFGDPETQPILMRLDSDLVELIKYGLTKRLDQIEAKWKNDFAVGIVLAAYGYPSNVRNNDIISGLDSIDDKNVKIFHAGTQSRDEKLYTSGGRVLCVVALDENIKNAQTKAYNAIKQIKFEGMQYRTDIADNAKITN
ncbi:MAG: phosphoribosylamine--glycine ligase [Neisseriaceae bacterium]